MMLRLLAISAASKGMGLVFFVDGQLVDWRVSERSARSIEAARKATRAWVAELEPQVVVTERLDTAAHKRQRARKILGAIAEVAAEGPALHVAVTRERRYPNIYVEAQDLGAKSELAPWIPRKRRIQDREPRNTLLFEALVLAETVMRGNATGLAAALG